MDMMTVLAGYSITVAELQLLFTKLKSADNEWPLCAPKLLKVSLMTLNITFFCDFRHLVVATLYLTICVYNPVVIFSSHWSKGR